ncbi:MAG: hypothetical protein AAGF27_03195 [Pseudomonadota bacterium]
MAILLLLNLAWSAYRNVAGHCSKTDHRLSEDEIIELAEVYALSHQNFERQKGHRAAASAEGEFKPLTIDEFRRAVPACCKVLKPEELRAEERVPLGPRMRGQFRTWVELTYLDTDGTIEKTLRVVTNCGKVRATYF